MSGTMTASLSAPPRYWPGENPPRADERPMRRWRVLHACDLVRQTATVAEAQAQAGMRPSLLTPNGWYRPLMPETEPATALSLIHEWQQVRRWKNSFVTESVDQWAEIVHAHCFAAAMAGLRGDSPVVYDLVSAVGAGITPKPGAWLLRSLRVAEQFVLSRAAAVVVHSQAMGAEALQRGVNPQDVFLVPDPVEVEGFNGLVGESRQQVTLFAPDICHSGDGSDLRCLVQAFATLLSEIETARLLVKVPAAEVATVMSQAANAGVAHAVEAMGSAQAARAVAEAQIVLAAAPADVKTLESFGYKPEYQWLANRPVKTANVIAVLKGTENPNLIYVLGAHYDSVIQGPGADDDISAMAALLETARVLAGKPLPSSVIFAAFTGEESGLWGSQEFARLGKERGLKVMAGLNNDVVGWMNDNRLDDTIRYSNAAIRDIEHAAALGFTRLITYDTHYVKSTDAASLYDVWGDIVGGLGSYPLLGSPHYHQPSDVLETVNHQLVTEVAKFNTAVVMLLTSSPSPVKGLKVVKAGTDGAELSWTPNPEKGISHYLVTWGTEGKAAAGSRKVKEPRAAIHGLRGGAGARWWVTVRAVNSRGLQSWDEAKAAVDASVSGESRKSAVEK